MKVSRTYEVWVGDDLVDDQLSLEQALALAREQYAKEHRDYPENPASVVIDEHSYITIESDEDLDLVDFVPQWRELNDTQS